MTLTVDRPAVEAPDAGVIEKARARRRHRRRVAGATLLAGAAAGGILFGAMGGGGGAHPGGATLYPGRAPAKRAQRSSASCGSGGGAALQGAPSKSLLSILAVLRRPATAADSASGIAGRGLIRSVFVHYIRRARIVAGSAYYIYPALVGGCGTRERPHEGIMELATNVDLGGGAFGGTGGGGASAAAVERGQEAGSGPPGSSTSATLTIVVPDGVAKVTLHYPAGPASGYSPKISPAFTITTAPVGNLVVVTVPRSNPLQHAAMVWRAADGHVTKSFYRLWGDDPPPR